MLLTVSTNMIPATDLGRLLHKHPDRLQRFPLSFGEAVVAYPAACESFCMAALQVEVSPLGGAGEAYVSDRAYAAGTYLSSAISKVFGTALAGRCESLPELAATSIPLEISVTPVVCRARAEPSELFGPLGWEVTDCPIQLDPSFPEWGSLHHKIVLRGTHRLSDALRHLCVLLPALDGDKHYFVADDEVDKLLRLGDGWLDTHPLRDLIVRRYLGFRRLVSAAQDAMQPKMPDSVITAPPSADVTTAAASSDGEAAIHERPGFLQRARIAAAVDALASVGARRVADMGCGEGDLIAALIVDRRFDAVIGVDPSPVALERASKRLQLGRMHPDQRAKLQLLQGAATYPDSRLADCDAFALLEVVEHVDPWRLEALEDAIFGATRPSTVVMTTPNREWNATIPALADGRLRHADHRFEWTRAEFADWAAKVCGRRNYSFEWFAVGPDDLDCGPPTQGAVFRRTRP